MSGLNDVCAGIVIYNPDLIRLEQVVQSIAGQVARLVLVNNGSTCLNEIASIASKYDHLCLINNPENEGIAKALNQICQLGYDGGYKWCLTLDQDTICSEDMVVELHKHTDNPFHAIVCPAVHYEGVNMDTRSGEEEGAYVYACMTSASLTSLDAWKKVGGYREDYFIDFVDNEFCMKLRLDGYKIYRYNRCVIRHQLGESREIRFLWFRTMGTFHSSQRCYYMMRNNVLFIKQYGKELNVPKEYVKVAYVACRQVLFSRHKLQDMKYIVRGLKDGFKGKTGKYKS